MSLISKKSALLAGARRFIRGEEGLVTVEWVALTAGMVVAAVAIGFITMQATATQADNVGADIQGKVNLKFGANGEELGD